MVAEAIAAILVGVALLWLVVQPIIMPSAPTAEVDDPPDPEETPRGIALLALKEIEFDRATGKLSDHDYAQLHAQYSAAAVAAIDAAQDVIDTSPSASDRIEAMVALRTVGAGHADGYCSRCGVPLLTAAAFCAACGAPAVR